MTPSQSGSPSEIGAVSMPRAARVGRGSGWARVVRTTTPYVFVGPFFIIFFAFFAYPVAYSFYVSLHSRLT